MSNFDANIPIYGCALFFLVIAAMCFSGTTAERMRLLGLLFLTGFIQIGLVSMNVMQIATKHYLGAFICSMLIGIIWSINVKRVAFGNWYDRFAYAYGCGTGCVLGLYITQFIYG